MGDFYFPIPFYIVFASDSEYLYEFSLSCGCKSCLIKILGEFLSLLGLILEM